MRPTLLLALFAVPVVLAAAPRPAAAQRAYRDHGRTVYVYRDGRGYRDRIFIPTHRYKEPEVRYRAVARRPAHRYGGDYRYRDGYRYDDGYAYRGGYRPHRRAGLADLLLWAARARYDGYRYRDGYSYRDRASSRQRSRCRGGHRHVRL
jgi:hypothetical protein